MAQGLLDLFEGRRALVEVPEGVGQPAPAQGIERRACHGRFEQRLRVVVALGALVDLGQPAHGRAPAGTDLQGPADGLGFRVRLVAGAVHVGQLQPQTRQQREPGDGRLGIVPGLVPPVERHQLPHQSRVRVPQVGTLGQCVAKLVQQLVRFERAPRIPLEGQEAVAERHLPHELGAQERQRRAPLGAGVAGVHELAHGEIIIDVDMKGLAEGLLGLVDPAGAETDLAVDRVVHVAVRLQVAGDLQRGERLIHPALTGQAEGQLAMRPGVGRMNRDQAADDGLGGFGAVLAHELVPDLVQGDVVREAVADGLQVRQGRLTAGRLLQQHGHGAVRFGRERLGGDDLLPAGQRRAGSPRHWANSAAVRSQAWRWVRPSAAVSNASARSKAPKAPCDSAANRIRLPSSGRCARASSSRANASGIRSASESAL